ncbi:MAG: hypothetical protein ACPGNV_18050, partial [Mangrovicoccus sp.]
MHQIQKPKCHTCPFPHTSPQAHPLPQALQKTKIAKYPISNRNFPFVKFFNCFDSYYENILTENRCHNSSLFYCASNVLTSPWDEDTAAPTRRAKNGTRERDMLEKSDGIY